MNKKIIFLQTALNFTDRKKALKIAKELVAGNVDFLEVGTLLIKAIGMEKVRELKKSNPGKLIAVDLKPINTGKAEMKLAIDAGADIVIITRIGSLSTIRECINAAIEANIKIYIDSNCTVCQINKELMFKYTGEEAEEKDEKNVIIGTIPKDALIVRGYELKQKGMDIVKELKELYPHRKIVANTKTITDAEKEFENAFTAGADIACILAIADIREIKKAVFVAKKYKKKVM
ncbi:MAG: hypothetical protein KAQ92_04700, partial [Candidatus Aenigmarchaeota archaeon]|nr:hypothetical protein [Candidatus Aenigmarchaeota archaeon]